MAPPVEDKDRTSVVPPPFPFACASPNVLQSSTIATSNGLDIFVIINTHVNLDFILLLLLILLLVRKYQLTACSTSGALNGCPQRLVQITLPKIMLRSDTATTKSAGSSKYRTHATVTIVSPRYF